LRSSSSKATARFTISSPPTTTSSFASSTLSGDCGVEAPIVAYRRGANCVYAKAVVKRKLSE
jgi:hypothetical protein